MILQLFEFFQMICRDAIHCIRSLHQRTCRGGGWVDVGRGRLRRPSCEDTLPTKGRRKRPLPAQPLPPPLQNGRNDFLRVACILSGVLALLITSCNWPGASQTQQPDPRLKAFHVLSARIIMLDTQAEVDGTLQNASQSDRFPYDVTVIATFYNSAGNVVGQAGGVAEDVYPGMVRPFTLIGQVESAQYSRMVVTVVSLKERRIEKIIPTPSIVP
jgi:hypothetical protein